MTWVNTRFGRRVNLELVTGYGIEETIQAEDIDVSTQYRLIADCGAAIEYVMLIGSLEECETLVGKLDKLTHPIEIEQIEGVNT